MDENTIYKLCARARYGFYDLDIAADSFDYLQNNYI